MTTFQAIRVDGPDDPDNEVDHDAWVKLKQLYDAFVGQTAAANKIPVWSSGTALTFESFTAKAIELCGQSSASAMLAVLGVSSQGRNVVPNGDFRVAQMGAGPFTSATTPANSDATYLLDGCILLSDGNDIVDVSQTRTVTPGGSVGGDAAIALDVETANKKFGIFIPIEARDAKRLIAGDAVLSFQARRGANATVTTLRAAIVSWQGTEDSITQDIVSAWGASGTNPTLAANWTYETTPADLTLTTSFQKFAESNGLAGAIDTPSTKNVGIFIWYNNADGTVGDFVYITDIQLEKGLVATAYEHVPYAQALQRNQRYLEPILVGPMPMLAQRALSTLIVATVIYRVQKRSAAPTLVHNSPAWATSFPSGNQIGWYEPNSNAYAVNTGAVTYSLANGGDLGSELRITAATSFDQTQGEVGIIYTGNTIAMFAAARL